MRKRLFDVQFGLVVAAIAIACVSLFFAVRAERRVELDTDGMLTAGSPEAILERANDAVNFADNLLSFLEGGSVVVGAILAAGAFVLRNSLQRQMEENREFVEKTQQAMSEQTANLNKLQAAVERRAEEVLEQNRKDIQQVREQAREAIHVLSQLVLAEQQVRAHNYDTALRMLEDAHQAEPDNYATNYLLGYLYTAKKDFDRAINHLEHALELEPAFAPAIAALGLALRRRGDGLPADQDYERRRLWAGAEQRLLDALERDPHLVDADGESYYGTLGGLYRRQGRYKDAIDAYEHARRINPRSSYPVSNLATLYHRLGRNDDASAAFERVRRIAEQRLADDPRDNWARADYVQALLMTGRQVEAHTELETLLETSPRRGTLQTFHDGLMFLEAGPRPIDGLEDMVGRLAALLRGLDQDPDDTARDTTQDASHLSKSDNMTDNNTDNIADNNTTDTHGQR